MALLKVVGDIVASNTITGNNIAANTIPASKIRNDVNIGGPKVTSISYIDDNTATDTAGGETVTITGEGFATGATVLIESVPVSVTTVVNANTITFTAPAKAAGSYILYVVNTDGSTAILVPGIQYSGTPTWTTSAGTLGTFYETASIANTVAATGDGTITYSLLSGALPTGASLNANGTISGSAPLEGGSSTYTFTLNAIDAQNQETSRQFSITIITDPVTWSAPANNATITTYEYVAISNTFVATSATGKSIAYSANVLPANVSISGATVSGTPTTVGNTTSLITATANTTGRTATRTLNFVVNQDAVTWSSPANNTTYTLPLNAANTVSLSATSAAGFNVSFSANSLPTGLSVSGNTITGTPTVSGNSSTLVTATAATTGRTAALTLNWVISIASDTHWRSTSLLIGGSSNTVPNTMIQDSSLNNNTLTVFGNTRPNNFEPYTEGYYSNYFDGTGDYLTIADNAALELGSSPFTIEAWAFCTTGGSNRIIVGKYNATVDGSVIYFGLNSSNQLICTLYYGNGTLYSTFGATTFPLNQWNHVAVTRDSSNVCRVFLNGVSTGTTATVSDALNDNSLDWIIGGSAFPWIGYLSNVRMVKGTALYTSTFTPPTAPLTAIANTQLLTCQSARIVDNSTNNSTITRNGDVTVSSQNPLAAPTNVPYKTLYSTAFDGNGDQLSVANNSVFNLATSSFTMELWMCVTGAGTGDRFLISRENATAFLLRYSGTTLQFFINGTMLVSYTYSIPLGSWNHVCVVRNGNVFTMYFNGTSVSSTTNTISVPNSTFAVTIGGFAGDYFQGLISNLRIVSGTAVYTSNFTPSTIPLTAVANTILLTCQDSTIKDNSSNTHTITSAGDARPVALSPFTMTTSNTAVTNLGSGYFDGSGDYITVPNIPVGTGNFTFEAWIYPTASGYIYPIVVFTSTGILHTFGIANSTSNPTIQALFAASTRPGSGNSWFTAPAIPLNNWSHVAFVRSGTTVNIYINGVLQTLTTTSGSNTSRNETTNISYIGATAGGETYTGYLNDVRVNNTALYTANFLPPQTPLTPVANTQLLTLQYNGDADNIGVVDQSSFNNLITRNGNTTQGTFSPFSSAGWSYYLNNATTTSYVDFSGMPAIGTGDFTVECWVFMPTDQYDAYASFFSTGPLTGGIGIVMSRDYFWVGNGTSNPTLSVSSAMVYNQWMHVAITRSGTTVRGFVNGTVMGTTQSSSANITTTQGRIGSRYNDSMAYGAFKGYISNVRVTKGTALYTASFTVPTTPPAVSNNTILMIANEDRFIDSSATNASFTIANTSIQAFSPFSGITNVPTSYSNQFDGTGDWLTVPNNTGYQFGTGDFTIEFWLYPQTSTADLVFMKSFGSWGIILQNTINWQAAWGNVNTLVSATSPALNAWNHIAITRSSGTVRIFINGVLDASGTDTTNYTPSVDFGVGGATSNAYGNLIGYISNLRIIKGTAIYTSTFTPSTTPLTTTSQGANASQVTLLTCQSPTMIDNSTNRSTITGSGDAKPRPFNPFGATTTPSSYSPIVNGGSMYFDGTGDYLVIPAAAGISGTGYSWTIQGWFYALSTTGGILDAWNSGTTSFLLRLTGSLEFYATGGSTTQASSITTGRWYHFAVVKDVNNSNTIQMYLNGVKVGTPISNYTTSITSVDIGVGGRSANGLEAFTGYLSDIQIIKGAALYTSNFFPPVAPATPTGTIGANVYTSSLLLSGTSGGVIDYHGTNNIETLGNAQLVPEDPYAGNYYSNYFDGTGDGITYTSNAAFAAGTGDFTLEAWFNPTSLNSGFQTIFAVSATAGLYFGGLSTNVFGLRSAGVSNLITTTPPATNRWTHMAASRQGTTLRLFIDGALANTVTDSTNFAQGLAYIGGDGVGNFPFNGYISNVRLVKGTALYTTNFTPSTTPLTAVSGTSLLTCQSNRFIDSSTNAFTPTVYGDARVKSINPFRRNSGKSVYFDGTGDYLTIPNSVALQMSAGNFTIEFWVYYNSIAGYVTLFDKGYTGTGGILIQTGNGTGRLIVYIPGTTISETGTATAGEWIHYALVRNGTTVTLYRNGVSSGSTTSSVDFNNTAQVGIGAAGTAPGGGAVGDYRLTGYMTDVRVTKGVARYTSSFTPPTDPLTAR